MPAVYLLVPFPNWGTRMWFLPPLQDMLHDAINAFVKKGSST